MLRILTWVLGFLLLWLVSVPVNGLVISSTWNWFIVPVTGAKTIGIAGSIGLSMFLTFAGAAATGHLARFDSSPEPAIAMTAASLFVKTISVGVVAPLCGLAIAWVWHTFAMS